MESIDIKGLNLKIDPAIQEICTVSNATSSSTRSVLYVLVIVSILALTAIINTHKWNWPEARIDKAEKNLMNDRKTQCGLNFKNRYDSLALQDTIDIEKKILESTWRNRIENYQTVRIPVLGNAFDVNDLCLVLGISFIILLIILRFSFKREINNLKIALDAITERYIDEANEEDFEIFLNSNSIKDNRKKVLKSINYTRRQHHYNFLSMNEIFNLPPLKIKGEELKSKPREESAVKNIFWFPFIVYIVIVLNDSITFFKGFELSSWHTLISIFFGLVFGYIIFRISRRCIKQKKELFDLYKNFKENAYKYIASSLPLENAEDEKKNSKTLTM